MNLMQAKVSHICADKISHIGGGKMAVDRVVDKYGRTALQCVGLDGLRECRGSCRRHLASDRGKTNDFDAFGERVTACMVVHIRNETCVLMLSPAIRILLSIWTGIARILPWGKASSDY